MAKKKTPPARLSTPAEPAPFRTSTFLKETMVMLLETASKDASRVNMTGVWVYPDGCAASIDGHRMIMVRSTGGPGRPEWTDKDFWSAPLALIDREDWRRLTATTPKGHVATVFETAARDENVSRTLDVEISAEAGSDSAPAMPLADRSCGEKVRKPPNFAQAIPLAHEAAPASHVGLNPKYLLGLCRAMSRVVGSDVIVLRQHGDDGPVLMGGRDCNRNVEVLAVLMPCRLGSKTDRNGKQTGDDGAASFAF